MIYLLDTNAASSLADPGRSSSTLFTQFTELDQIGVSVVTVGELLFGSYRIKERAQRESISLREASLLATLDTVFAVTIEIAQRYAEVKVGLERQGSLIPENDLWIAATALIHGCVVVSSDRHFDRVPTLTRIDLA